MALLAAEPVWLVCPVHKWCLVSPAGYSHCRLLITGIKIQPGTTMACWLFLWSMVEGWTSNSDLTRCSFVCRKCDQLGADSRATWTERDTSGSAALSILVFVHWMDNDHAAIHIWWQRPFSNEQRCLSLAPLRQKSPMKPSPWQLQTKLQATFIYLSVKIIIQKNLKENYMSWSELETNHRRDYPAWHCRFIQHDQAQRV